MVFEEKGGPCEKLGEFDIMAVQGKCETGGRRKGQNLTAERLPNADRFLCPYYYYYYYLYLYIYIYIYK